MEGSEEATGCPDWVRSLDFLNDPTINSDPFPALERLRNECPAAWIESDGGYWLVTSYEGVRTVVRDPDRFSNREITPRGRSTGAVRSDLGINLLIQSDAPLHWPYRQTVAPLFSPRMARGFEGEARRVARALLESIRERGECEFVADFAVHIPSEVVMPLIGVPVEDRPFLLEAAWGEEQRPRSAEGDPDDRMAAMKETRRRQVEYFRSLIERRRETAPFGEDLIGALLTAKVEGRSLTMNEMLNLTLVLYNAGLHTTTNTISNMMVVLSQRPELRDRLVARPEDIPAAVEELMRWESIVTGGRLVTRDTVVAGASMRAGDVVLYSLGSAGRDESEFGPDAGEIDFDRGPTRHLQFGAGPHRCLGSHLARMEARVALEEIHRMIPNYRLKPGTVPIRHTGQERGTEELWLLV